MLFFLALAIFSFLFIYPALCAPEGIAITSNVTEEKSPNTASSLTTPGGSFTTMTLNGSFQTPRWKAYVGNVSGQLRLSDTAGYSIYDWDLAAISGEVYVSRNDTIQWADIECITNGVLTSEQASLNLTESYPDSINKTFNNTVHKSFLVGTKNITASSCRAIATYVNNASQSPSENANFQEILLQDNAQNVVYATLIESSITGFDGADYDFQIIVPDNPDVNVHNTYYFFAEIS